MPQACLPKDIVVPEKPLLILDLDETLFHTAYDHEAITRRHGVRPDFSFEQHYHVFKRPGVHDFVAQVADSWRLAVWTSATQDYAQFMCERILRQVPLEFMFDRRRCTRRRNFGSGMYHSNDVYMVKDLKKVKRLGYALDRMLLIEDRPENGERQYGNLVRVPGFYGDPSDDVLPRLARYLDTLVDAPSFRSIEKRGWQNQVPDNADHRTQGMRA